MCEYCEEDISERKVIDIPDGFGIIKEKYGKPCLVMRNVKKGTGFTTVDVPISFCPWCGKKL